MWMSNDCLSILEANEALIILERHQHTRESIRKGFCLNSKCFNQPLSTYFYSIVLSLSLSIQKEMTWRCRIFFDIVQVHNETRHDINIIQGYTITHLSSNISETKQKSNKSRLKYFTKIIKKKLKKQIPLRQSNLFIYHSSFKSVLILLIVSLLS